MRFLARQSRFAAPLGIVLLSTQAGHLRLTLPRRTKLQWNRERQLRAFLLNQLGIIPHQPGRDYFPSLIDSDDRITEAPIFTSYAHPSQARIPGRTFDTIAYIPGESAESAEAARQEIIEYLEIFKGIHVFGLKTITLPDDENISGRFSWRILPNRDRRQERESCS